MARGPLRFAAVATTIGWPKALLLAPLWAVSRRFVVLERPLDDLSPLPEQPLPWEPVTGPALAELTSINPLLGSREIERRVAGGMTCYAYRQERRIVHYRWYATAPAWLPFLELTWVPEPGDYTSLDVFTAPELRGRGIHSVLALQGLWRARDQGFRRCVSFIAWWNRPSLMVAERHGFRRVGSVTSWRCGPMSIHTAAGSPRVSDGTVRVPAQT